jgi:erythromycin esterase-like protein
MPTQMSQLNWPMTDPAAALSAFLATLSAAPQLLGLGEPTHGVESFALWRNRVFQTLVETQGFRSIAIESDIIAGLQVDAYIASGQGTLDEVMTEGFSHGFGARPANRELVVWMRQFNAGRNEADRLRFHGFDPPIENMWAASPRHSLLALHDFLAQHFSHLPVTRATLEQLCGDDARWTNPAAAMDPSQSIGATAETWHLRALADDLVGFLETQRPEFGAQPDLWTAQVQARTALGLLRYHANLAAPSPDRISQMLALRAVMMTENLLAIAEREEERGPTLVFAHTSHLQRGASQIRMDTMNADWWPAGAHLLGRDAPYAVLAMSSGEGTAVLVPEAGEGLGQSGAHLYATPGRLERDGVLILPESAELGDR